MIIHSTRFPIGKEWAAINLFGIIIVKDREGRDRTGIIRHEKIHTAQMKELLYFGFYLIYILEWVYRLMTPPWKTAYRNISFEKEAREHMYDPEYLGNRKHYAQWSK